VFTLGMALFPWLVEGVPSFSRRGLAVLKSY